MALIDGLLLALHDEDGSDLHLASGRPPFMRKHGRISKLRGYGELAADELEAGLREICPDWKRFSSGGDLDFAYGVESVARFRANYFLADGGVGAVFRVVPEKIRSLLSLGLPPAVEKFVELNRGFVVVSGPSSSGKSTTLAALIDAINRNRRRHIVTLERPVEFVHTPVKAVISHRQVGTHVSTFAEGLRAATRQDADVIMVGDLHDPETIELALGAAEMGALVFGAVQTRGVPRAVGSLIDAFPYSHQGRVRGLLAETFKGGISQLLLPASDGKRRVLASELLLRTGSVPGMLREGRPARLAEVIAHGHALGMQSLDEALLALVRKREIHPQVALRKAEDKARFIEALR